jgi:RsiW-degrading membrane proteinase PrsW (M82 family)
MDSGVLGLFLLIPSMVCSVVPMVVFLAIVWWLDRYHREPIWLLVLTFLWGALGGVLFGIVGSLTLLTPLAAAPLSPEMSDAMGTVVVAPLAEEPAKALFLLVVLWNRQFDQMTDGFVYGAAAGLGFGMTENLMYFSSVAIAGDPATWVQTVIIRTLYSAVMHASATSIVGASLGFVRFRGWFALVIGGFVGLLLAMGMHALWNGLITLDALQGADGTLQAANMLIFPLEVLTLFVVFQVCLLDQSRAIRHELTEEAAAGLVPRDHPAILASWLRRRQRDWLPKGVDHHRYVSAATTLALRKRQLKQAGLQNEYYRDEVFRLRRRVKLLLDRAATA